jgi:hypothetical protein
MSEHLYNKNDHIYFHGKVYSIIDIRKKDELIVDSKSDFTIPCRSKNAYSSKNILFTDVYILNEISLNSPLGSSHDDAWDIKTIDTSAFYIKFSFGELALYKGNYYRVEKIIDNKANFYSGKLSKEDVFKFKLKGIKQAINGSELEKANVSLHCGDKIKLSEDIYENSNGRKVLADKFYTVISLGNFIGISDGKDNYFIDDYRLLHVWMPLNLSDISISNVENMAHHIEM